MSPFPVLGMGSHPHILHPRLWQQEPEHTGLCSSFADVLSVEMKGSNSLEFSLKTEQLILHSPKAPSIKTMVELFMQELRQVRQELECSGE